MEKLSKISDKEIDKISDEMSEKFLKKIRNNFVDVNFSILEKTLGKKYIQDNYSAMFLDGRKGIRIIVDHGTTKQWSEINCKTEIKIFKKSGIKVTDHIITKEVYSYVVQPNEELYQELKKIPDATWLDMIGTTRSIPQDILGHIEKTVPVLDLLLKKFYN